MDTHTLSSRVGLDDLEDASLKLESSNFRLHIYLKDPLEWFIRLVKEQALSSDWGGGMPI